MYIYIYILSSFHTHTHSHATGLVSNHGTHELSDSNPESETCSWTDADTDAEIARSGWRQE